MTEKTNIISHPKKAAFLAAYVECGTISHAAKAAEIRRETHHEWVRSDPVYAAAFAEAKEQAVECLEREARRRAIEGVDEPVYQGGELVGYKRRYSDTLLIFMLKAEAPDKYKERMDQNLNATLNTNKMQINVVMDENFYGNANRIYPQALSVPSDGASLPCPTQNCQVGASSGKNGNGSNSNGSGTRT